jgi:hypothetical protein
MYRTKDKDKITNWEAVDLDVWDKLGDAEREILVLEGGIVFVKKVREFIEGEE